MLRSDEKLDESPWDDLDENYLWCCDRVAVLAEAIFSDRAAYIQVGAMIGTIMAGNVFFNIIPNQKIVVADLIAGRPVNPEFGKAAKLRSMHNNYLTLPVLFIMTSNHYPMTYGSGMGWLSLAFISLAGVSIRHYFNLRHATKPKAPFIVAAIVFMGAAIVVPPALSSALSQKPKPVATGTVDFAKVRTIIQTHCTNCHSSTPTHEFYEEAPNGFMLDSDELIKQYKTFILDRAVKSQDMPLGNDTGMTDKEREVLRVWATQKRPD